MPWRAANSGEKRACTSRSTFAFSLLRSIQVFGAGGGAGAGAGGGVTAAGVATAAAGAGVATGAGGGCAWEQESAKTMARAVEMRMGRAEYPRGPCLQSDDTV
jgi:hypothetical protein